MKKKLSFYIIPIVCVALALSFLFVFVWNRKTEPEIQEENPKETKTELIRVEEGRLYQGDQEVILRGCNLGGWLLQESWMCPVIGSESNTQSFELLSARGFTEEQIQTLYRAYAENYITKSDFEIVADLELNCVRIPFWWRNFLDADGNWYTENSDENPGFVYLDRAIQWAKETGIYVILDLHGCPGGQSQNHSCGVVGKNELWESEENLKLMEDLWVAIAQRYHDSEVVAAYDIMNEPMNNDEPSLEKDWAAGSATAVAYTNQVYDRMIRAIRGVDAEHVITLEGIWEATYLPDPKEYGWTNMMYQLHLYDRSVSSIDYRVKQLSSLREQYGVAVYVGEFNNGDANQEYAYSQYLLADLNWTMWTYKTIHGDLGNWSLYSGGIERLADIPSDSYETILSKWERVGTDFCTRNEPVYQFLKTHAQKTAIAEN